MLCSSSISVLATQLNSCFVRPNLAQTHSLSLTLVLTHSLSLSYTFTLFHSLTHSHSLSLSYTLTLSHSLSLSYTLTLSLTLVHTHSLSLFHSLTLSLTHSLTHTPSLSLIQTHTTRPTSRLKIQDCFHSTGSRTGKCAIWSCYRPQHPWFTSSTPGLQVAPLVYK